MHASVKKIKKKKKFEFNNLILDPPRNINVIN